MCYFVIITEAFPDYKRPYLNVQTKVFKTTEEVEEYKKQFEKKWKKDNSYLIDNPDQDIWDDDFLYGIWASQLKTYKNLNL